MIFQRAADLLEAVGQRDVVGARADHLRLHQLRVVGARLLAQHVEALAR